MIFKLKKIDCFELGRSYIGILIMFGLCCYFTHQSGLGEFGLFGEQINLIMKACSFGGSCPF